MERCINRHVVYWCSLQSWGFIYLEDLVELDVLWRINSLSELSQTGFQCDIVRCGSKPSVWYSTVQRGIIIESMGGGTNGALCVHL